MEFDAMQDPRQIPPAAGHKVIERAYLFAARNQRMRQMRPNESRTTRDQNMLGIRTHSEARNSFREFPLPGERTRPRVQQLAPSPTAKKAYG